MKRKLFVFFISIVLSFSNYVFSQNDGLEDLLFKKAELKLQRRENKRHRSKRIKTRVAREVGREENNCSIIPQLANEEENVSNENKVSCEHVPFVAKPQNTIVLEEKWKYLPSDMKKEIFKKQYVDRKTKEYINFRNRLFREAIRDYGKIGNDFYSIEEMCCHPHVYDPAWRLVVKEEKLRDANDCAGGCLITCSEDKSKIAFLHYLRNSYFFADKNSYVVTIYNVAHGEYVCKKLNIVDYIKTLSGYDRQFFRIADFGVSNCGRLLNFLIKTERDFSQPNKHNWRDMLYTSIEVGCLDGQLATFHSLVSFDLEEYNIQEHRDQNYNYLSSIGFDSKRERVGFLHLTQKGSDQPDTIEQIIYKEFSLKEKGEA